MTVLNFTYFVLELYVLENEYCQNHKNQIYKHRFKSAGINLGEILGNNLFTKIK